jgi:hypothetical protein
MDVSASAIAELNDKRKFAAAADTYEQICRDSSRPIIDAAFHFQGHLAHSMIGGPVEIVRWRLKACPDYDTLMEADLWRDTARQIMREKWPRHQRADKHKEAYTLLANAAQVHATLSLPDGFNQGGNSWWPLPEDDALRLTARAHYWADMASLARLNYIQKQPRIAHRQLLEAVDELGTLDILENSPSETETYLRNAAFDGLRTATRLRLHADIANFVEFIVMLEPSWKKRWAAGAICYGGRPALAVVERFFR